MRQTAAVRALTSGPEASGRNSPTHRVESALRHFRTELKRRRVSARLCSFSITPGVTPRVLISVKFVCRHVCLTAHKLVAGAGSSRSDHTKRGNCMTISSQGRFAVTLLFGFYCLTVAAVYGQTPGASGTNPPARSSDREKVGRGGAAPLVDRPAGADPAGPIVQRDGQRARHEHDHDLEDGLRFELHHHVEVIPPGRRHRLRSADYAPNCAERRIDFQPPAL